MTNPSERTPPKSGATSKDEDHFWLTDLYPDASELFSHAPARLEDVKDTCFVVLDANVLLWPYEFNSASLAEVDRVYGELSGKKRLIVPGQAAREFYKHRSRKVAALSEVLDGTITRAKKPALQQAIPLLQDDADYQVAQELSRDLITTGKKLVEKLESVRSRLQSDVAADPVSAVYRKRLYDCIVELDQMDRSAIVKEVERRGRLRIAPGFKDQAKEDGGVGDYLIWLTILQAATQRKSHCIFVTNEEKSDWWIKSGGAFQPRPELLDEYRRASGGFTIHLLPLSELLSLFSAEARVVQGVQNLEEASRQRFDFAMAERIRSSALQSLGIKQTLKNQLEEERSNLAGQLGDIQQRMDLIQNGFTDDISQSHWDRLFDEGQQLSYDRQLIYDRLAENASKLAVLTEFPDPQQISADALVKTKWSDLLG